MTIRILILVFSLFQFSCCTKKEAVVTETPTTPTEVAPIKYLALGDSYTIGESVQPTGRYPVQFAKQLNDAGIETESPQIIATTGWRTDQLIEAVANTTFPDTFDLVSLLIGVNNQFQGKPISTYEKEFEELLQTSIDLAGGDKNRVFVLSIPDYAFTPYGQNSNPNSISEGIDNFNAVNKTITENMGVRYFNITPISRKGVEEPALVASDGLHPSAEQYRRWVEVFFEEMKEVVK